MYSKVILEWMDEHHIEEQCIERFWETIANYKSENPERFAEIIVSEENLSIELLRMSFDVPFHKKNEPRYSIVMDVFLMHEYSDGSCEKRVIGYYREEYLSDGKFFNCNFVLD